LKSIGYIKHPKVIVLIDSGDAHNLTYRRVVEETHYYVHAVHNFQIMIANRGMMKCGGMSENGKLRMGGYQCESHMLTIEMGGLM
jgi:hypothetical protein